MTYQAEKDCKLWLLETIADSASLSLADPRATDWPNTICGALLAERSLEWAKRFTYAAAPMNTLILIPMRVGVNSVSLLIGALHAGLFPILIKPAMPANLVLEAIKKFKAGLVASPIAMIEHYKARGFIECAKHGDYAILASPDTSYPHPNVNGKSLIGIYSSGSTGNARVIVHTLDNVLLNATLHARSIGLSPNDTVALSLPLNFSAGLVAGLLSTLLIGSKGIFVDTQKVNPRRLLSQIPISVCMSTPSTVLQTYSHDSLKRARIVTVGGDVLHANLANKLLDVCSENVAVYSTYGMTEAGPRVCSSHVTHEIIEHYQAIPLGQPLNGVSLFLDGQYARDGARELRIATPTAMYSYLYDAVETAKVIDEPFGMVRTGDLFREISGALVFAGRASRVIVRGGENIYPASVEAAILRILDFDDVWVTAEKDTALGEVPKAYVVGGTSIDPIRLTKSLRQHLPISHIPVFWELVSVLPDNSRK